MNERIRELLYEAGGQYGGDLPTTGETLIYTEEVDYEKFAELIILECEKVAKDPKWYGESPSYGWGRPIRHVCKVMKDHFGVKE